jgi:calcium-dependent protein kinase
MKKFAAMNKLKKAALLVIAKSLDADEITGLQQLFRSIDVDGSGTITVDELRTAMRSLDAKLNVRGRLLEG